MDLSHCWWVFWYSFYEVQTTACVFCLDAQRVRLGWAGPSISRSFSVLLMLAESGCNHFFLYVHVWLMAYLSDVLWHMKDMIGVYCSIYLIFIDVLPIHYYYLRWFTLESNPRGSNWDLFHIRLLFYFILFVCFSAYYIHIWIFVLNGPSFFLIYFKGPGMFLQGILFYRNSLNTD